MNVALGLLTQLLHLALVLGAAPLVAGLAPWLGARMRSRRGAPPARAWRRLAALLRKRPVLSDDASAVSVAAPYAAVAATAAAAALVPSFSRGMALAPLADLVLVAGLLGTARAAAWLAALDAGTPGGAMGAARAVPPVVAAEPVLLLCALVLAALTGRTNLDALWAAPDAGPALRAPLALCAAALAAVVLAEAAALSGPGASGSGASATGGAGEPATGPGAARAAMLREACGRHLALWEFEAALRLLVWLSLPVAMFLPAAAPAGAGPLGWLGGLLGWGAAIGAGCLLLAAHANLAPPQRPGRAADPGLAALLLALLGALLLLAAPRAA